MQNLQHINVNNVHLISINDLKYFNRDDLDNLATILSKHKVLTQYDYEEFDLHHEFNLSSQQDNQIKYLINKAENLNDVDLDTSGLKHEHQENRLSYLIMNNDNYAHEIQLYMTKEGVSLNSDLIYFEDGKGLSSRHPDYLVSDTRHVSFDSKESDESLITFIDNHLSDLIYYAVNDRQVKSMIEHGIDKRGYDIDSSELEDLIVQLEDGMPEPHMTAEMLFNENIEKEKLTDVIEFSIENNLASILNQYCVPLETMLDDYTPSVTGLNALNKMRFTWNGVQDYQERIEREGQAINTPLSSAINLFNLNLDYANKDNSLFIKLNKQDSQYDFEIHDINKPELILDKVSVDISCMKEDEAIRQAFESSASCEEVKDNLNEYIELRDSFVELMSKITALHISNDYDINHTNYDFARCIIDNQIDLEEWDVVNIHDINNAMLGANASYFFTNELTKHIMSNPELAKNWQETAENRNRKDVQSLLLSHFVAHAQVDVKDNDINYKIKFNDEAHEFNLGKLNKNEEILNKALDLMYQMANQYNIKIENNPYNGKDNKFKI